MADQPAGPAVARRINGYGPCEIDAGDVVVRAHEAGELYELARAGMRTLDKNRERERRLGIALEALRRGALLHVESSEKGTVNGTERAIPSMRVDTAARVPVNVAADQLGVTERQVRKLLAQGRLTGTSTRPLLVDVESLMLYAACRLHGSKIALRG